MYQITLVAVYTLHSQDLFVCLCIHYIFLTESAKESVVGDYLPSVTGLSVRVYTTSSLQRVTRKGVTGLSVFTTLHPPNRE